MDPFEFAHRHFVSMYDVARNKAQKCHEYRARLRYIFSHVDRPTRTQVANSMKAIARVIVEIRRIGPKVDYDPTFYYHRTVEILKQECPATVELDMMAPQPKIGCHGIGGLLAQHLVAILSLLGVLPVIFLSCAEIARDTRVGRFLIDQRGFSNDKFLHQTSKLLESVQERIEESLIVTEEAVCQWKISLSGRRTGKGDWTAPGCPLMYLEELESFGHCKSRKRLALNVRILNCDGSVTSVPPLNLDLKGLEALCPQFSRDSSTNYWNKTGTTRDKHPRRQASSRQKGPQAQKLFSVGRNGILATPDPTTVISFLRKSHTAVLESAYHAVRNARKEGRNPPSDKELFEVLELSVEAQAPILPTTKKKQLENKELWNRKLDKLSKKEKGLKKSQHARPGIALMVGRHKPRKFYCYGIKRDGKVHFPPASFPLYRGQSVVVDGRRYFANKDDGKEHSCMYDLLHHREIYIHSGSRLARELFSPPSDLSSAGAEGSITALKVIPEPGRGDPSLLPKIVCCTYPGGGYGILFTDSLGNPQTSVYPVDPPSQGTRGSRTADSTVNVSYNGIIEHKYNGARTQVRVCWCDGLVTWELLGDLLSSGSHWHLFRYAQAKNLLSVANWKNLKRFETHCLGVNYFGANRNHSTIEAAKKEERRRKKGLTEDGNESTINGSRKRHKQKNNRSTRTGSRKGHKARVV